MVPKIWPHDIDVDVGIAESSSPQARLSPTPSLRKNKQSSLPGPVQLAHQSLLSSRLQHCHHCPDFETKKTPSPNPDGTRGLLLPLLQRRTITTRPSACTQATSQLCAPTSITFPTKKSTSEEHLSLSSHLEPSHHPSISTHSLLFTFTSPSFHISPESSTEPGGF